MNYIQLARDLKAKQKALLDKAKAENRAFSAEELEQFNTFTNEIDTYLAMAEAEEKSKAQNAVLDMPADDAPASSNPNIEIKNEKRWGRGPMNGFGEFLKAVANSARGRGTDERLTQVQDAALGGNTQVSSDGGFLIEPDMMDGIVKKTFDSSALASRCAKKQVGPRSNAYTYNQLKENSRASGSRFGGIQGYWIGEGGTITASNPELEQKEVKLNKMAGLCYLTEEQLEDGPALLSTINEDFPSEFGYMLDEAILHGIGAGTPLGIYQSAALISVAKEAAQAADTIVYENILKMWARMYAPSRANAVWLINQDCEPELDTMALVVGASGVPVYMPAGGVASAGYATLKGRPVIPVEQAKTVGDLGDISLVDLSQYQIVEKGTMNMASSIHVQFLTDQTAFRFIWRVGGQPRWSSALTPANGSNTLSPFVGLAERA